jgi:hypothetical protein
MPLLAASGGGEGERMRSVRGEVVVRDVVFPVNAARGELPASGIGSAEEPGAREMSREKWPSEVFEAAIAQERRAHPRVPLATRSELESSRLYVGAAPPADDLDP